MPIVRTIGNQGRKIPVWSDICVHCTCVSVILPPSGRWPSWRAGESAARCPTAAGARSGRGRPGRSRPGSRRPAFPDVAGENRRAAPKRGWRPGAGLRQAPRIPSLSARRQAPGWPGRQGIGRQGAPGPASPAMLPIPRAVSGTSHRACPRARRVLESTSCGSPDARLRPTACALGDPGFSPPRGRNPRLAAVDPPLAFMGAAPAGAAFRAEVEAFPETTGMKRSPFALAAPCNPPFAALLSRASSPGRVAAACDGGPRAGPDRRGVGPCGRTVSGARSDRLAGLSPLEAVGAQLAEGAVKAPLAAAADEARQLCRVDEGEHRPQREQRPDRPSATKGPCRPRTERSNPARPRAGRARPGRWRPERPRPQTVPTARGRPASRNCRNSDPSVRPSGNSDGSCRLPFARHLRIRAGSMPAVPQPQRRLRALSARPWPYGPCTNGSLLSCAAHCCNPALRSDRPADRPGPAAHGPRPGSAALFRNGAVTGASDRMVVRRVFPAPQWRGLDPNTPKITAPPLTPTPPGYRGLRRTSGSFPEPVRRPCRYRATGTCEPARGSR